MSRRGSKLRGGSLWARAPFLLLRYPGALLAILGASLVIGLAASSDTMFMSSTGSAALQFSVERAREGFAGLRADAVGPIVPPAIRYREDLLHRAVHDVSGLGPLRTIVVSTNEAVIREAGRVGGPHRAVRLATSTGFLSQVDLVRGAPGPGWWVSRNVARTLGVGPGASLDLAVTDDFGTPTGAVVRLTVRGIYTDLCLQPQRPYWVPLTEYIQLSGDTCPPPLLLADEPTFLRAESALADDGEFHWELPVDTRGLTLPAARDLATELKGPAEMLADPVSRLGAAFSGGGLGLPPVVEEAQATNDSLAGSVHALSLAGRLLALLVMAIAGVYTIHRRRVEFRGLAARGMGPLALGWKVAAEALLPALAGAAAGWAGALVLVRALGPSADLDPGAVRDAALQAGVTVLLAVLFLGVVAAAQVAAMGERRAGRARRRLARRPWELAPLALAGAALYEIWTRGAVKTGPGGTAAPSVDVLVPLFPILFMAGVGGLVVRALRRLLPRLRTAGRGSGAPAFLAARRLSAAPSTALLLVAASFLAVGLLGYSGVVVSSISATTDAKSKLFVGSDAALTVPSVQDLPGPVLAAGTPVVRYTQQTTFGSAGTSVDVLVVDPATFAAHAFWDSRLAPTPLSQLLAEISVPVDGRLPLLSVGPGVPAGDILSLPGEEVPVRVVRDVDAFPGLERVHDPAGVGGRRSCARHPGADPGRPRADHRGHGQPCGTDPGLPLAVVDLRVPAGPRCAGRGRGAGGSPAVPTGPPGQPGGLLRAGPAHGPVAAESPAVGPAGAGGDAPVGVRRGRGSRHGGRVPDVPEARRPARHPAGPVPPGARRALRGGGCGARGVRVDRRVGRAGAGRPCQRGGGDAVCGLRWRGRRCRLDASRPPAPTW